MLQNNTSKAAAYKLYKIVYIYRTAMQNVELFIIKYTLSKRPLFSTTRAVNRTNGKKKKKIISKFKFNIRTNEFMSKVQNGTTRSPRLPNCQSTA